MRAKGLLSVVMTGALMASALSGCGFEPDITWTDTADGSQSTYKVTVVVAHNGTLDIDSEQNVKDDGTLNFIATPSKDGDHRITGLMIDGVKRTDYTGELPLEGEVKISLENINQDMTVVVLCDNETGGLGGVDGAVTGLDGTGTDTGTDTGDQDENEAQTTASLRFVVGENETEHGVVYAENAQNDSENVTVSDGSNLDMVYEVNDDEDINLIVTPLYGYEITAVMDGENPIDGTYKEDGTFTATLNVEDYLNDAAKDLDLNVDYAKKDFTVTTNADGNGTIQVNEGASATVKYEENVTITVDANEKKVLDYIQVTGSNADGSFSKKITSDQLSNNSCQLQVTGDMTVTAHFKNAPIKNVSAVDVTSLVYSNGDYKVEGTATVVYNDGQNSTGTIDLSDPEFGSVTYEPVGGKLNFGNNTITVTYKTGDELGAPSKSVKYPVNVDPDYSQLIDTFNQNIVLYENVGAFDQSMKDVVTKRATDIMGWAKAPINIGGENYMCHFQKYEIEISGPDVTAEMNAFYTSTVKDAINRSENGKAYVVATEAYKDTGWFGSVEYKYVIWVAYPYLQV